MIPSANYSRLTKGLKQSDVIKDQQFKLVYVYPMLFDNSVAKYENTIRQFLSVSMLKEIFVDNAINIIDIAASHDERQISKDVHTLINKSVSQDAGRDDPNKELSIQQRRYDDVNPYELQTKIKEKTAFIKKYINSEPRIKSLMPFVELLTLNNLIDVPVVVGTKKLDIDSLTMAFILSAAIANDFQLRTDSDINSIFRVLKQSNKNEGWKLFSNLAINKKPSFLKRKFEEFSDAHPKIAGVVNIDNPRYKKVKKIYDPLDKHIKRFGGGRGKPDDGKPKEEKGLVLQNPEFDIMKTLKSDLSQAELFFKFMVNDDLVRSQHGLEKNPGQMSTAVKKISTEADQIFIELDYNTSDFISYNMMETIRGLLYSIFPKDRNVMLLDILEKHIKNKLVGGLVKINEEVKESVIASFESSTPDDAEYNSRILNGICGKRLTQYFVMLKDQTEDVNQNPLHTSIFDEEQLYNFITVVSKNAEENSKNNNVLASILSKVLIEPGHIINKAFKHIIDTISEMIETEIVSKAEHGYTNLATIANLRSDGQPLMPVESIPSYVEGVKQYMATSIFTVYLVAIHAAICQYVKCIDVEIETVKNSAIDLPNYTLVLPLDTIVMLHAALVSKSWKSLVEKDMTQELNLSESYIKGVVKYISNKLKVPNLFVIDTSKNIVYYKLMYMSAINKTNLKTFETFVQTMTQNELEDDSY